MSLAAISSFGFVIKRLSMKGTSPELRKIILNRNAAYFIFYLFIGAVNALTYINASEYGWGTNNNAKWPTSLKELMSIKNIIFVCYYVCGLMLAVVRF